MKVLQTIVFLLAVSIIGSAFINRIEDLSQKVEKEEPLKDIDLSKMTKVNDEPVAMLPMIALLCKMPSEEEIKSWEDTHPHDSHYINVYVNDKGKVQMTEKLNPVFPEGTVIVKEKFPLDLMKADSLQDKKVDLYTVMIKRHKGYNPICGDWEFAAVSGDLQKVEKGKLANCMNCHVNYTETDYVFRKNYLSKEVLDRMK
ncbi:MAG: cytochrome P460 family protein [Crocinitomicaceae bacterium]|nr:cytochrome P460 family protein [Crocinitomicaceae bacterium]